MRGTTGSRVIAAALQSRYCVPEDALPAQERSRDRWRYSHLTPLLARPGVHRVLDDPAALSLLEIDTGVYRKKVATFGWP
jgi:hypothetical protein